MINIMIIIVETASNSFMSWWSFVYNGLLKLLTKILIIVLLNSTSIEVADDIWERQPAGVR